MTKEEIEDYNKKCAVFIGGKDRKSVLPKIAEVMEDNHYWLPFFGIKHFSLLKFHSDWNWIMEVLKSITKVGYNWELIDFNGSVKEEKFMKCSIFNLEIGEPYNKFTYESSDEKETVVKAIYEFLIWYNERKIN